jgi:hypothetical protein
LGDQRIGIFIPFMADDRIALLVDRERPGEVVGATGEGGHGADEFGEEFGPLGEQVENMAVIVLSHDVGKLLRRKEDGVLLDAIDVDGASAMLEGFNKGGAGFEFVLAIEPLDVAVLPPEGNVGCGDARVAGFFEMVRDVDMAEAAAEHVVDGFAHFVGETGDFAGAGMRMDWWTK